MIGRTITRGRNSSLKCLSTGSLPTPFPRYFFPKQRACSQASSPPTRRDLTMLFSISFVSLSLKSPIRRNNNESIITIVIIIIKMPLPWAWAAKKSNSSSQFCWKNPRYLYTRAQLFKGNRVKFIPGFFFFCSKAFSWIFLSIPFRVSNHQIVCTKRSKLNLLFKFSYLNSNFALGYLGCLGYLKPALNKPAQETPEIWLQLQWLWFCGLHILQLKTPHSAK